MSVGSHLSGGLHVGVPLALVVLCSAGVASTILLDSIGSFHSASVNKGSPVGWVAILSAVFIFGSFGVLIKAPAVEEANASPIVFQCYYSFGVIVTSVLLAITLGGECSISPWGFLGGALWVTSQVGAVVGVRGLGYALAIATWAGETIIVSFLWGTLAFHESPASTWGASGGVAVLVCAVALATRAKQAPEILRQLGIGPGQGDAHKPFLESQEVDATTTSVARGLIGATVCGLCNGSLMVPYTLYSRSDVASTVQHPELVYMLSFGIGVAISTSFLVISILISKSPIHFKPLLLPGFLTGFYWSCGNLCATYATQYLGNTVGYPLTQTCIVVSGLWGIFYYRELTAASQISAWAASATLIIVGAAMLAIWGLS